MLSIKLKFKIVLVGVLSIVITPLFTPSVYAVDESGSESTTQTLDPTVQNEKARDSERSMRAEANSAKREQQKTIAREKLDSKKNAVCAKRSDRIVELMGKVETRTQEHFKRITNVYEMTKAFYESRNLTIANYSELISSVESTKISAESAANTLMSLPEFSCSSDGPKADLQNFKNKRLDKIQAFGSYREAVKELLTAVRSAAENSEINSSVKEGN